LFITVNKLLKSALKRKKFKNYLQFFSKLLSKGAHGYQTLEISFVQAIFKGVDI